MFTNEEIIQITAIVTHAVNARRGHQTAKKLSKKRRREIAKHAAAARWNKHRAALADEKSANPA